MAGYRRLISYIYAYEGEEKGKNIGFAKLEARNGQCRLSINVKKIYAGGNDMGVYLLSSGQEIFLGNIFRFKITYNKRFRYFYPQWQRGFQDLR